MALRDTEVLGTGGCLACRQTKQAWKRAGGGEAKYHVLNHKILLTGA